MESKSKYKSSLAFTDLLFNVLIGFAFMFIVAFILINPVEKDAEIQAKAEFMIIMEWDDQSAYDIDLWMQDPVGNVVGFPNMHAGLLHLDKDDLGQSNDRVVLADGTTKTIFLNREVMTIRGIVPGEYIVNNHLYSMKGTQQKGPIEVTTKVIKLNPFGEIHAGQVTLTTHGQEETIIRFTIDPSGYVKSKNRLKKRFAGQRQPGGYMTSQGSASHSSFDTYHDIEGEQMQGDPADDDEVHSGTEGSHYNPGAGFDSTPSPPTDPNAKEEEERRGRQDYDPGMGGF